jgi:hypothetical protein
MKKTQKITRLKLDIDDSDDFTLLGLVCSDPDYKISLLLNNKLKISLRNIQAIKPDDEEVSFSNFSNIKNPGDLVYSLISNRSGKHYLLNKLKNIDYLLQVQAPDEEFDKEKLIADLRGTESITAVFNIDIKNLKDKNLQYLSH